MYKYIKYRSVILLTFLFLSAIIFASLNGVANMIFGLNAPFSPLILLLSIIIVFIAVFKEGINPKRKLYLLMVLFFISYLFFSSAAYLYDSKWVHPKLSQLKLYRSYFSSMIVISAFYFAADYLKTNKKLNWLLIGIFSFTLFSATFSAISPLIGFSSILESGGRGIIDENRNTGLYGNPNIAGTFGLYFVTICLTCYSYFRRGNLLFLLALPVGVYVAVTSFSRAAILFFPVLIVYYIIHNIRFVRRLNRHNGWKVGVFTLLVSVCTIVVASNFFRYVENLSYNQRTRLLQTFQLLEGQVNKKTTAHRSDIFEYAIELIVENPIVGHGIGSFHKLTFLPGSNKMGAHNTQLLILGEGGIVPFIFFLLFIGALTFRGVTHTDPALGFFIVGVCAVFFFVVSGAGHNALGERTSNALIGVAMALSLKKKN